MSQAFAHAGAFIVNADLTPNPPKTPLLEERFKDSGRDFALPTAELVNRQFPSSDGTPRMAFVRCDVTRAEDVEAAVAFAVQTYGRLDIMVNGAGVTGQDPVLGGLRTHEEDERRFDVAMDVNVKGVWLGVKYATSQMLKQEPHSSGDRGWIINMCSIVGHVGAPRAAIYTASKGKHCFSHDVVNKSSPSTKVCRCRVTIDQGLCPRVCWRSYPHQLHQSRIRRNLDA